MRRAYEELDKIEVEVRDRGLGIRRRVLGVLEGNRGCTKSSEDLMRAGTKLTGTERMDFQLEKEGLGYERELKDVSGKVTQEGD